MFEWNYINKIVKILSGSALYYFTILSSFIYLTNIYFIIFLTINKIFI